MESGLIFRVNPDNFLSVTPTLELPGDLELITLISDRVGEDMVFGQSEIPGIWVVHAVGRLIDWTHRGNKILLHFSDVRHLPEGVNVVTEGDIVSDRLFQPYLVDTLLGDDLARVFESLAAFAQASTPISVAAEDPTRFFGDHLVGGLQLEVQDRTFFHKVATTYAWRCAVSRIRQSSIDGLHQEGVVLGLDEPYARQNGEEGNGLFLSSSFAFAYRHGLLAIGDDYELLRHAHLGAEMRMFLEISNPKALLHLPANREHWPLLEAIRSHRRKFGY